MRAALLLAVAAIAAGCVQPPEPAADSAATPVDTTSLLGIEGRNCRQAGGYSTYDKEVFDSYGVLPEPWVTADISEDVGRKVTSSQVWPPVHTTEKYTGNYHVSVLCESRVVDGVEGEGFGFGWVAIRVEAPPFDDPSNPADRHYLTTMLSFTDPALVTLLAGVGIGASEAIDVQIRPEGPFLYTLFDDPGHGVYESYLRYEPVGEVEPRVTRVWLLVPLGGHHGDTDGGEHAEGPYRPVAIDFVDTAATHLQTPLPGTFSHMRTEDHYLDFGPAVLPIPGTVGDIPGLAFFGMDRTIRPGPQPDVTLEEMYDHL